MICWPSDPNCRQTSYWRFITKHGSIPIAGVLLAFGPLASTSAAQTSTGTFAQASTGTGVNVTPSDAIAIRAMPGAPRIDGRLDDEAWKQAPVISDFTQRDPNEGEPGTELTEARILYSDDAIYVGVRAFDSQAD